jgi:asparagine synthase (glutamine-hydrolysing)
MCGFVGLFSTSHSQVSDNEIEKALNLIKHRGPDSSGQNTYRLSGGQLSLGFRRLAIIDLSPSANQPFLSSNGNLTVVFNGEIYNYLELRSDLRSKGHVFKTNSDTEVLVNAWHEWGKDAIPKLVGMFSFVILDKEKEVICCVRDAYGIKPFFYKVEDQNLIFASEIKPIQSLSTGSPKINTELAMDYILGGEYDRSKGTFFAGVSQLEPGHFMEIDLRRGVKSLRTKRWWYPSVREDLNISFSDAAERLREEFCNSVEMHLRSDVRVATALSGGLDSSAIVCVIRKLRPDLDIHTFSYIASNPKIDESKWVDLVNRRTNSIPHKIEIKTDDFRKDLDDLIVSQGEPFGSTSLYAQYRIYQAAHEAGVTVMLDGQGADELLAGYFGYPESRIRTLIEKGDWLKLVTFISEWSKWPDRNSSYLLKSTMKYSLPVQIQRILDVPLARRGNLNFLNRQFEGPSRFADVYPNDSWGQRRLTQRLLKEQSNGALVALLRHADRNSMRWSIESRVPFLTIQLSELVLSFPENFLLNDRGETKSVFREAMRGIVDENILNRRDKIGLATPQEVWINPEWFKDATLLDGLKSIDFLKFNETKAYLELPSKGSADIANRKWRIFNLVKWKMLSGAQ